MHAHRTTMAALTGMMLLTLACSKQAQVPAPDAHVTAGDIKPGDAMLYRLVPESAQLSVTVLKDAAVPVTGTFEAVSGLMASQGSSWSGFVGTSTAGFRTGKPERDANIQVSFFQNPVSGDVSAASKVSVHWTNVAFTLPAADGVSSTVNFNASLELGAMQLPLQVQAIVTRTGPQIEVVAERVAVSISQLGMGPALETLKQVCGHKSVEDLIRIAFRGTFRAASLSPASAPVSSTHP